MIETPSKKAKTNLQYREYQEESRKLLDFCEKMMGKREREVDSSDLEQPEFRKYGKFQKKNWMKNSKR